MQELLRWLAALKGIKVEPGADLQFELTSFPTGGLGLLTLIGLVLALSLVVFVYRRDGRNLSTGQRVFLGVMRAVAVLLAFLVVLEPNLVTVKKDIRDGHSIIILDLSQSMGHHDAFRRDEVQKMVQSWNRLGVTGLPNRTRMELAKAVLSHEDFQLIEKLNARNKVLLYGFDAGLHPLPLQASAADPAPATGDQAAQKRATPLPDLDKIQPEGKRSNLGGAIRAALQKSRDASIASVIVLTDGRRNLGAKGAEISRYLTQRKVGHTLILGVGDPSETQTVGVSRIEAPERAFQKDPFKIRASVVSQGYESETLTVRLVEVPDGGGAGTVVQQQQVNLSSAKPEAPIEFDNITVAQAGVRNYRVEVGPPAGEPLNAERHTKQARVEILEEKTRVLLIAGSPLHEYQILRQLLTRDATIDLACWLESADNNFLQDGNTNLKRLPTDRKELEPYDVFIIMDPDPAQLDRQFCEMVANQVEENGAGLWFVCGEKFSLDALEPAASTAPIADLLPVVPHLQLAKIILNLGRGFGNDYPFELTPQGREHSAMRLVDGDRDANGIMWGQLPGWHFAFPVKRGKPAARVLAESNASHKFKDFGGSMPLVATHFIGAGRVMFTGTDETYRWRSLYEDQYNRFWVKGIRYLYEGRLTAGSSRLRINLGGDKLELGEPIKITVEAKGETYQPLVAESYTLKIARGSEPPENFELRPVESQPGTFEASYRPTKTGFFRVLPLDQELKVDAAFQVVAAAVEKEGPVDLSELGALAQAKGGRLLETPDDLLAAAEEIKSRQTIDTFRTPHAMWDSWLTIASVLFILALEWWLRKRWNLL